MVVITAACASPPPAAIKPAAIATLPSPVVTPQPELSGVLWVDQAFGEIWRIELPSGAPRKVLKTDTVFPAQPALPKSGAPLAYMAGEKIGDGYTNRFGIYVDDKAVIGVHKQLSYQDPALSPDGATLFATQIGVLSNAGNKPTSGSNIVRVPVAGGSAETVVPEAMQPDVSPDGAQLVYIALDVSQPPTVTRSVRVTDLASGATRVVLPDTRFYDMFGPRWLDAGTIVFAAIEQPPLSRGAPNGPVTSLLDRLFGLRNAQAHSWVGDVWSVRMDGSQLRKLTPQPLQAPIPAASPDGAHIVILSGEGLWVLPAGGGALTKLSDFGGNGGVVWTR